MTNSAPSHSFNVTVLGEVSDEIQQDLRDQSLYYGGHGYMPRDTTFIVLAGTAEDAREHATGALAGIGAEVAAVEQRD
jgi:hypothetical protein